MMRIVAGGWAAEVGAWASVAAEATRSVSRKRVIERERSLRGRIGIRMGQQAGQFCEWLKKSAEISIYDRISLQFD
jgi:hypothetical protein